MFGNDIISIKNTLSHTPFREQQFIEKMCTLKERELFLKHSKIAHLKWIFWSIKESAYKASFREIENRVFSPKKWEIIAIYVVEKQLKGEINTPTGIFVFSVHYKDEYIYSECKKKGNKTHYKTVLFSYKKGLFYESVIKELKLLFPLKKTFQIVKNKKNVPALLMDENEYPISLSHDFGRGACLVEVNTPCNYDSDSHRKSGEL